MNNTMIDKSNWTTKTLGEVCEIKNGKDHKPVNCPNGEYPIYGSGGIMGRATQYICEAGTTVIGRKGSINNPIYVNERFWNVDTAFGLSPKENCIPRFIYYWCRNTDFTRYNKSTTLPSLTKSDLLSLPLPVPPLSIQLRIVEELDSLSRVLARKREQLLELDNLAQALFFSFFGDPVVNEKGWEVKKLGEVCNLLNGRAYRQNELLDNGKYMVLRVGNFFSNNYYYYSDLELPQDKYCKKGDLLYAWSASFGARIWSGEKCIYHYHIWKMDYDKEQIDKIFLCYLLNITTKSLTNDTHGVTMVHLTKCGMEQTSFILPPLSLQRTFSEQVSKIEEMKRKVKASISEVQTLMDERMQRWFG